MKVYLDKKLNFRISCEDDQDLSDADQIDKMTKSGGWKILAKAFYHGNQFLLDEVMDITSTEASRKNADLKAATLKGFTNCVSIPEQILGSAEKLRKSRKKNLEEGGINESDDDE